MQSSLQIHQHRALACKIMEALALADQLGLTLVGISLDGALAQLIGTASPLDADDGAIH